MKPIIVKTLYVTLMAILLLAMAGVFSAKADSVAAAPPFSQDWSNAALITTSNDWSGVPAITGYRGDNVISSTATGIDPQTILADDITPVVHVYANQSTPNTNNNGGVVEFDGITDPVIALQGSGTAKSPYLKIIISTTGINNIHISYDIRDIDGSVDNAVQQVALHYRVGGSGNFINLSGGYIADATEGPSLATKVTHISLILPSAADNQPIVELRIMTTNATGNDEWVGIDNISITANYPPTGYTLSVNSVFENQPVGTTIGTFTAEDPNASDTHTFALVNSALCPGSGADNTDFSISGNTLYTAASFDYETKSNYEICVQVTDNNGLSKIVAHAINILDADEIPPAVVVNWASGQPALTKNSPVNFTVVFNEPINIATFTGDDLMLNGTAGAGIASVTEIAPYDGTTFNAAVSGMSNSGTVIASISAGMVLDPAGNGNTASASLDNTINFDMDPPTVNAFSVESPATSFDMVITSFTASDNVGVNSYMITQSPTPPTVDDPNWSTVAPATYTVNAEAIYTLYPWTKDEAGNVSNVFNSPASVTVDFPPKIISFARQTPTNIFTNADILVFRVAFSEPVVNVDPADFSVNSTSTATVTDVSVVSAKEYDVTISGGDLDAFNGTVGLNFSNSPDIQDSMGNHFIGTEPATDETYTLDNLAPDINITAQPSNPTASQSASFIFSSTDNSATFVCNLDASGFSACISSKDYNNLNEGSHTFAVKAIDVAGNISTAASYTWTIDLTAPDIAINSKPANPSNSANANFTFSSTDVSATFECKLDGGNFTACADVLDYTGLAEGLHTFTIQASDIVGNSAAANYSWTIDLTAPDIAINSKPVNPSNSNTAQFKFSSSDNSALFMCSLDNNGFTSCISPKDYTGLSEGSHTFSVKALDEAGNTSATETYQWTIDLTAPQVSAITRAGSSPSYASNVSFSVTFSENVINVDTSDFTITKTGTIKSAYIVSVTGSGSTYTVKINTGTGSGSLRLDIPATATFMDAAGNRFTGPAYTSGDLYAMQRLQIFRSQAIYDGQILESSETTGAGGFLNSTAQTIKLGDDRTRKQYRGILSFSTGANLPDTAVITSVTLKVYKQGVVGVGNPVSMFQGFMIDMKRGLFGATGLEATDFQVNADQTFGAFVIDPLKGWYSFNLTGGKFYINKTSANGGLTQIRLRFKWDDNNNNSADYLSLYSGNASIAYQPQLIVEYYVR